MFETKLPVLSRAESSNVAQVFQPAQALPAQIFIGTEDVLATVQAGWKTCSTLFLLMSTCDKAARFMTGKIRRQVSRASIIQRLQWSAVSCRLSVIAEKCLD